ncbi:MAG TPA: HEPN domain-containing protein [Candidatus Acetothermia bacterium]|nr:HEPN domain-containing protein [Candidatus Acetothermia bacterium]
MMDRAIRQLLDKAQESLAVARLLRQANYYDFAASRAYYGMFYVAEAALLSLGLSFSKHSAVVAAFGWHLANEGLLPRHLHRYLLDAFDLRAMGDYHAPGTIETNGQVKLSGGRTSSFKRLIDS